MLMMLILKVWVWMKKQKQKQEGGRAGGAVEGGEVIHKLDWPDHAMPGRTVDVAQRFVRVTLIRAEDQGGERQVGPKDGGNTQTCRMCGTYRRSTYATSQAPVRDREQSAHST